MYIRIKTVFNPGYEPWIVKFSLLQDGTQPLSGQIARTKNAKRKGDENMVGEKEKKNAMLKK